MIGQKLETGHSLAAYKENRIEGYSCLRRDSRREADGALHLNEEVSQVLWIRIAGQRAHNKVRTNSSMKTLLGHTQKLN